MESDFFALIYRLRYISRWNGTNVLEPEDVSQHSFNVAIISHILCEIRITLGENNIDKNNTVICALYHDCTDSILTHVISPVKNNDYIKESFLKMKDECLNYITRLLPKELNNNFIKIFNKMNDPDILEIIEIADIIDTFYKSKIELNKGNLEFSNAHMQSKCKIDILCKEKEYVKYFIDNFVQALDKMEADYRYINSRKKESDETN